MVLFDVVVIVYHDAVVIVSLCITRLLSLFRCLSRGCCHCFVVYHDTVGIASSIMMIFKLFVCLYEALENVAAFIVLDLCTFHCYSYFRLKVSKLEKLGCSFRLPQLPQWTESNEQME